MGDLIDEINLDYAVIERVNRADLSVLLIPFNLGRVLANAQDPDNLLLSAGDIVTVFSANDVRLPYAKRRVNVRVEGEVVNPGVYQMSPGETLQNVLAKAGGLTKDAYLFGASFLREDVRKTQEENLQQLMRRLEAETASSLTQLSQSQGATSDRTGIATELRLQSAQAAQKQALERLRSLRPTGRIALGLSPEVNASVAKVPAIRLQNKDQLVIPSKPDFVYVFGSVNTESALLHKPGRSVADYLEQSGLASGADRHNVILLRVDGSAMTSSSAWGNNVMRAEVMPGDTIVMPEKVDRETAWSAFTRNTKDLTQIFFNLGLGAAALKTLRQ
jgi:protein involved in polysaccharide export with SLBB domain